MPFLNKYAAPSGSLPRDIHLHTPLEEYDFNYVFPVETLRSDRVELRPYTPSLHAELLWKGIQANPEILRWLGTAPWQSLQDVLEWSEKVCRAPSDSLFYAIFTDKPGGDTPKTDPSEYEFAGVLGMISSSVSDMMSEPGWILIMKPYQRTHVLTHAAGLVMHRILDPTSMGGLGLRRCQWTTTVLNAPSQNAAKRLGYTGEGVLRAIKVLQPGKEGFAAGRVDSYNPEGPRRDNWYASVLWDEWENGVRAHIDKLMARRDN
ncbi:hypothetical protein EHS25_010210 [Saitozyma podzolica]|uniref:N-acetyltransferase domain-containing protein n=1 Tax=Saitozyma podzolica TaxID=1890683 RepID=A0A427YIV9_9TREE|nr:hypothetical protein EHS25_010210 [Saitozyma podzolica]